MSRDVTRSSDLHAQAGNDDGGLAGAHRPGSCEDRVASRDRLGFPFWPASSEAASEVNNPPHLQNRRNALRIMAMRTIRPVRTVRKA